MLTMPPPQSVPDVLKERVEVGAMDNGDTVVAEEFIEECDVQWVSGCRLFNAGNYEYFKTALGRLYKRLVGAPRRSGKVGRSHLHLPGAIGPSLRVSASEGATMTSLQTCSSRKWCIIPCFTFGRTNNVGNISQQ